MAHEEREDVGVAEPRIRARARFALETSAIVIAYFLAGKLGLSLAFVNESASGVWPPTGIALAAGILLGARAWPGVFVGAFLVNVTTSGGIAPSIGIAFGNTLEAVLGVFLVTRYARGRAAFERATDVLLFVFLAAGLATMVSATIGVGVLVAFDLAPMNAAASIWVTWWLGDAAGALTVTPVLVLWATKGRTVRASSAKTVEAILLAGTILGTSAFVFGPLAIGHANAPIEFICIPPVIWAAFRFGSRAAASSTLLLSGLAIWGTLAGFGPFARGDPNESLLLLQAFTGVITIMALPLAAVVTERARAEAALERGRMELEARVTERTESLSDAIRALEAEVAERANAEMHLARSRTQLAHAQKLALLANWEWDPETDIVTGSEDIGGIYGVDIDVAPGGLDALFARVPAKARADTVHSIMKAFTAGEEFVFEHRVVTRKGAERWVLGRGAVIRDASSASPRVIGTAQDVTDSKRAEESRRVATERLREIQALRDQDKFRTAFMNRAAHELSTPLTPIKIQLFLMKQKLAGTDHEALGRGLGIIDRNFDRLHGLVSDLLDASRIESDRLALVKGRVDVRQVFVEAIESFEESASASGVVLASTFAPELLMTGDARRLSQVAFNLLSNAIKFTPRDGTVTVDARSVDGVIIVRVTDSGIGIAPEAIPRLFKPFSQVHDTKARPTGGTGLGLHISRGIVELHGGTIVCESGGLDKGTTFIVHLPITGESA